MWDGPTLTALAAILTAIGGGIGWLVRTRSGARPAVSRQTAEVASASDAVGGALSIVQNSLSSEIDRLRSDHAEDREAWARQSTADRERIAGLEATTKTLRADVDQLRQTEGRLVGWVGRLHAGITDGSIPPLPPVPEWLTRLLSRDDTDR